MSVPPPPHDVFTVRDFALESGIVLPEARLAYRIDGVLGDMAPVLTCSAFAATHLDLAYLAADDGPLSAAKGPVIRAEMLGNGRSTSPSNTPSPWGGADFPALSIRDDVALQARLLDHLGVKRVRAVVGASMGAQQAVQWAVLHPERVESAILIAGNAETTLYGQLFLHTVASALTSDPAFAGGRYTAPPLLGLSRLSETWAPFALSPRFFSTERHQAHADMSGEGLDGFLAKWRTRYHAKDANDLLSHLRKWQRFSVADTPGAQGSFARAAARAGMPILFLPISTDAYFHPGDVKDQAAHFPDAEVRLIESLSGHAAAFGREATDRDAIRAHVESWLA